MKNIKKTIDIGAKENSYSKEGKLEDLYFDDSDNKVSITLNSSEETIHINKNYSKIYLDLETAQEVVNILDDFIDKITINRSELTKKDNTDD